MKAIRYNMFGFSKRFEEVYCELAGVTKASLRKVATPGMDDHLLKPEDFETVGHLSLDAAKIIMKTCVVPASYALCFCGPFAQAHAR